jgi:hypothetical protein
MGTARDKTSGLSECVVTEMPFGNMFTAVNVRPFGPSLR